MLKRLAGQFVFSDEYKDKMRFIAGPRQSGKTTLVQHFQRKINQSELYFNWDKRKIRSRYHDNPYFYNDEILKLSSNTPKWICFDEIHKMPRWKNILKDIYDTEKEKIRFIITGSARLDLFRKSGDSLAGRYFLFHLFPLFLSEIIKTKTGLLSADFSAVNFIERCLSNTHYYKEELDSLIRYSGFPEPFCEAGERFLRVWRNNYLDSILREDLRDLSAVKNIEDVAKLISLLPSKIGSPLSINSLVEDMEVSYQAVKHYIYLLELIYFVFKIPSYTKKISRAIKKEKKYYLFDWTRIADPGAKFENYIAFELFNFTAFLTDNGIGDFNLHYIRSRSGEETDFLVTRDQKPWLLFESKISEESVAKHNIKHSEILGGIPLVQLVNKDNVAKKVGGNIYVVSASRFIANLYD